MTGLSRWWRHAWSDESDARRALPSAALTRLHQRVAASEARHGGEIRVVVEAALPWSYLWKRLRARDRALMLFGKLRVWDTERNNGVLIYLLLADHAIEIVADRGLARHVDAAHWQAVVRALGERLRRGDFEGGLSEAVDAVDAMLVRHFARDAGDADTNELPDRPLVG